MNLFGALFQLFLVSRLFKYVGVRGAIFVLPFIAMFGGMLFGAPCPANSVPGQGSISGSGSGDS